MIYLSAIQQADVKIHLRGQTIEYKSKSFATKVGQDPEQ
jgi:hypothetical protein